MVHDRGDGISLSEARQIIKTLSNVFGVPTPHVERLQRASIYEGEFEVVAGVPTIRLKEKTNWADIAHEFAHYIFYLSRVESISNSNTDDDVEHRFVWKTERALARCFRKLYSQARAKKNQRSVKHVSHDR